MPAAAWSWQGSPTPTTEHPRGSGAPAAIKAHRHRRLGAPPWERRPRREPAAPAPRNRPPGNHRPNPPRPGTAFAAGRPLPPAPTAGSTPVGAASPPRTGRPRSAEPATGKPPQLTSTGNDLRGREAAPTDTDGWEHPRGSGVLAANRPPPLRGTGHRETTPGPPRPGTAFAAGRPLPPAPTAGRPPVGAASPPRTGHRETTAPGAARGLSRWSARRAGHAARSNPGR